MGHAWQNRESGKRNYSASPLKLRNDKLQRAASIAPVRISDIDCEKIAKSSRVMTAADYVRNCKSVEAQVTAGREAHLLVRDIYNEGEFLPMDIYDVAIKHEYNRRGMLTYVEFDLHAGLVLVKPDTVIYWK